MTYYTLVGKDYSVRLYRSADAVARFLHANGAYINGDTYLAGLLTEDAIRNLITNDCYMDFAVYPEAVGWTWRVTRHEVDERWIN